ncbi:probable rhamnogalacturonate lyase B [Cajanus cajan]|uniref:probable rhamnogalacturonate lyase B n=1 Tax=Cajanus cajan TaxID=3821 RepID=UPI00098DC537|nr:probable rhamnogalacturonate lyase B [Cajanus cajan]XP_020217485.1 probable rhamnogalacturonate lyase B [Cajanus cajan]
MKVACQKRFSFQWWFGIAVQLSIIMLGACSRKLSTTPPPPVKLNTEIPQQVVIGNGIVSLKLSNPEGHIIQSYTGIHSVFDEKNAENDRGYFDVVWNGAFERIQGTNFSVIVANDSIVEVSFLKKWTASLKGSSVPINIDQRYILRRGDSGFYSYIIFNRPPGFPEVVIDQIRIVYKLDDSRFHYMAISDTRQRDMPTAGDRAKSQPLAYKEAVLITHPSKAEFKDEVDDKYQYSCENKDNKVHGWISSDPTPVGFWLITPSDEFRHAGPVKQDLTSHVGPITLSMFVSTHYVGKDVEIGFAEGETYKKVFGPVFIYLNTVSDQKQFRSLWSDAVEQLSNEVRRWPYDFVGSNDFIPPNQRGTVAGVLHVQDGGKAQPASNAYVGLALPGFVGSWQTESKGYQFWTQADKEGHFLIKNIVPGDYNLYAWVPGFIGDYKYATKITIKPGGNINLNSIVYNPPRNGPTLWEIGIPDRSAAEFLIPDPEPGLRNRLYSSNSPDKFRQYGLWDRYTKLFSTHDLVYTVGVDDYHTKWFFAHVNRNNNNTYVPTTWQIQFHLQNIIPGGKYTLQLALASANDARVLVRFNDPNRFPDFSTGLIGGDNAIARHGIHGLYRLFTIVVGSNQLVQGKNVIYLTQSKDAGPFAGAMYDYIRLESPPTKAT